MKKLIRGIVLSRTFLQSADLRPEAHAKDPDNRSSGAPSAAVLDFESMRDSMLRVAGRLEAPKLGASRSTSAPISPNRAVRSTDTSTARTCPPSSGPTFDFANPDYHVPRPQPDRRRPAVALDARPPSVAR
jgi:hypothetical protein